MFLQIWQIIAVIVFVAGFAGRLGYVYGEGAVWDKMDDLEETIEHVRAANVQLKNTINKRGKH